MLDGPRRGQVRDKKIQFRITIDFKQKECGIEEWADRLVLSVVKQDPAELLDDWSAGGR